MYTLAKRNAFDDFFGSELFNWDASIYRTFNPSVVKEQTDDNYILKVVLPGYTKEDVEIILKDDILTIKSQKTTEFGYSAFEKQYSVLNSLTEKDISAEFQDGILKITIKKVKPIENAKRIEIK